MYFLHGDKVSPAPRTVTATAALQALPAGPDRYERTHGRTTAIPSGTRLRSLVVRNHVATAAIDREPLTPAHDKQPRRIGSAPGPFVR
jgi:spore germination protein GerM